MLAFCFRVDGKHFENGVLQQSYDSHAISQPKFFFEHKSKMTRDCWFFFNSSGTVWMENTILMRFQSENMVFKFLQCNADRVVVGKGLGKIPDFLWTWF